MDWHTIENEKKIKTNENDRIFFSWDRRRKKKEKVYLPLLR